MGRFELAKNSMSTGSLFYFLILLGSYFTVLSPKCCHKVVYTLNIIFSLLLGFFGGNLIWIGQFVYLNKQGKQTGRYFSLFNSIYQFSSLGGNLFNYFFYSIKAKNGLYFAIFASISLVSTILFAFLPEEEFGVFGKKQKFESQEKSILQNLAVVSRSEMLKMLEVAEMKKMTPLMILGGLLQGLWVFFYITVTRVSRMSGPISVAGINENISIAMVIASAAGVLVGQGLQFIMDDVRLDVLMKFSSLSILAVAMVHLLAFYSSAMSLILVVSENF